MVPTVYLDQNALSDLYAEAQGNAHRITFLDHIQIVLSPVHWIEVARITDANEAARMANFMDALSPRWLRERIAVGQSEIEAALAGHPREVEMISPIVKTKTQILSELATESTRSEWLLLGSSWEIVRMLRPGQVGARTLEEAYGTTEESFKRNVVDFKLQRSTDSDKWAIFIRGFCKQLNLVSDVRTVAAITPESVPSLAVQFEIAQEYWSRATVSRGMRMRPQRQNDTAHLSVALPYVDYLISRDTGIQNLVERVRSRLPFQLSRVFSSAALVQ